MAGTAKIKVKLPTCCCASPSFKLALMRASFSCASRTWASRRCRARRSSSPRRAASPCTAHASSAAALLVAVANSMGPYTLLPGAGPYRGRI